jgi:type II secretory pathway pseudopilin PulG
MRITVLIILILLVLGLLALNIFQHNRHTKRVEQFNLYSQEFETFTTDANALIAKQQSIIINDDAVIKNLLDSVYKLNIKGSKIKNYTSVSSTTGVKGLEIRVEYRDSIINNRDTIYFDCGSYKDAWANIKICSNDSIIRAENISFNDTTITIMTKKGLFKNKYEAYTISSSPYKSINSHASIVVDNKTNKAGKAALIIGAAILLLAL